MSPSRDYGMFSRGFHAVIGLIFVAQRPVKTLLCNPIDIGTGRRWKAEEGLKILLKWLWK